MAELFVRTQREGGLAVVGSSGLGRPSWKPEVLNINVIHAFAGRRAVVLGMLALAIALWRVPPAYALPAFAGQTGAPCSACHVGGFGPQLTPFGISFRANGYTLSGGTGPWAKIPVSVVISPSVQYTATALPEAPAGYGTNGFFNALGTGTALYIAGGHYFGNSFGIGGFEQLGFSVVPGSAISVFEATSDFTLTKRLSLGDHSLLLGFHFTNTPSGGDPYNTLYNGFTFPYLTPFVGPVPSASPAISVLGTTVYGLSLYALFDNNVYAEAGLYQTWSPDALTFMNITPSSLGTIFGVAPYLRIADQHTWANNFLEVGGVAMNIPLNQIPGVDDPSAQNSFFDWGFDATYQHTFGQDTLAVTTNILFEQQTLGASFASGISANASNSLTQFRIAASYYWNNTYGFTLAYNAISGSTDTGLFAPAPLTGSANGSPDSQAIIAQIDWTPFGKSTTDPGYPWLNVRIGLQYTHYLEFNGGTTNYDGFGRNASDNDTLLLFTWWAF
jgi:hypothetical protein